MEIEKIGYKLIKKYPGLSRYVNLGDIFIKKEDGDYRCTKLSSESSFMFEECRYVHENPQEYPEFFEEVKIKITVQ